MMPNATTANDVYSVSKIRTSQGRQGEAYSATLVRNGKVVASVIEEANGGCLRIYWQDKQGGKSAEEDRFNAYVEEEKAKISASAINDEVSKAAGFDVQEKVLFNDHICIENMVNKALDDRRWKRLCKTNTLFQVGSQIGSDKIQSIKGTGHLVRAWVISKYPGQKIRFLNDEYQG